MKLGMINSAWEQHGVGLVDGLHKTKELGFDCVDIFQDPLDDNADDADDGQLQFLAGLLDGRNALLRPLIQWILKNIHAIKTQFLGFVQPVNQPNPVLFPS